MFRGGKAHDFEWLRTQYFQHGGARFPPEVNKAFTLVSDWSTDLRYLPRTLTAREADAFLAASSEASAGQTGGFEMAVTIARGSSDTTLECIMQALQAYERDHPRSRIDLYRQNPVSVRVRVIDPDFADRSKVERSKIVWRYLTDLSEDCQSDISMLVLLAPDETEKSFSNLEFEDPIPSIL